jgi:hypothetical protein
MMFVWKVERFVIVVVACVVRFKKLCETCWRNFVREVVFIVDYRARAQAR